MLERKGFVLENHAPSSWCASCRPQLANPGQELSAFSLLERRHYSAKRRVEQLERIRCLVSGKLLRHSGEICPWRRVREAAEAEREQAGRKKNMNSLEN